jgi:hypothetical protein
MLYFATPNMIYTLAPTSSMRSPPPYPTIALSSSPDDSGPRRPQSFKFKNFWTSIPGFMEVVAEAWSTNTGHAEPYQNLFHKLKGAAKGHTK